MINRDKNKIVVFGALNMDLIVETPRTAGPGETAEGTRFYTAPGGKGGNQAVAASRLADGVDRVLMVGRIGNDVFGAELRSYLEKQRVNTKYVQTDIGQSSGVAVIFVEPNGQNYVNPVYGANARCDDWQTGDTIEAMKKAAVLLVQQEIPLAPTLNAMQAAREMGVTVILDPAPARDLPHGFLEHADILTPNQLEAEALAGLPVTGPGEAATAARRIRDLGIPNVIVTLGEQAPTSSRTSIQAMSPRSTRRSWLPWRQGMRSTARWDSHCAKACRCATRSHLALPRRRSASRDPGLRNQWPPGKKSTLN